MTNKLRTSKQTQEIFEALGQSLGLQPYILSKLAIALSVKKGKIIGNQQETDNDGLELSRQTIFGDHDLLFKALIINNECKQITDEEYFPDYVKAHLDRGAELLERERKYSREFLIHLSELERSI